MAINNITIKSFLKSETVSKLIFLILAISIYGCETDTSNVGTIMENKPASRSDSSSPFDPIIPEYTISGYLSINAFVGEDVTEESIPLRRLTKEAAKDVISKGTTHMIHKIEHLKSTYKCSDIDIDDYIDNQIYEGINRLGTTEYVKIKDILLYYIETGDKNILKSPSYTNLQYESKLYLCYSMDYADSVIIPFLISLEESSGNKTAKDCYDEALKEAIACGCLAAAEVIFSGGTMSVLEASQCV